MIGGGNPAIRPDQANQLPRSRAGSGPAPQSAFIVARRVIVLGPNGGEFVYDVNNHLRSSNVGQATTDPIQGLNCPQGFATWNGHGAVVNLLSTGSGAAGFIQYLDNNSAVQGAVILSVNCENATFTDPVTGATIQIGMEGINPAFGNSLTAIGSQISLGVPAFTQTAQINISGGSGANQPFAFLLAPEQGQSGHLTMVLTGVSPDGTKPAQLIIASEPTGTTIPGPVTKALAELQGSLALVNAALPGFVSTAWQQSSVAGVLTGITGSGGLSGGVPLTQSDGTVITVTAASSTRITKAWPVPANDPNAGSVYRLTCWGFGTNGSTLQNLTWSIALNGAGVRSVVIAPPGLASAAFRWRAVIDLHFVTIGAGGTADVAGMGIWTTTASPGATTEWATGSPSAGAEAFNTTIGGQEMHMSVAWASTTGAPTITCIGSTFERIGP